MRCTYRSGAPSQPAGEIRAPCAARSHTPDLGAHTTARPRATDQTADAGAFTTHVSAALSWPCRPPGVCHLLPRSSLNHGSTSVSLGLVQTTLLSARGLLLSARLASPQFTHTRHPNPPAPHLYHPSSCFGILACPSPLPLIYLVGRLLCFWPFTCPLSPRRPHHRVTRVTCSYSPPLARYSTFSLLCWPGYTYWHGLRPEVSWTRRGRALARPFLTSFFLILYTLLF